ncbi:MAG: ABC transporter permease [Leptolinea sp.]|jgi:simple sugar transport system permease protein|nr:ABC transporter permease [Leptolinea sp.]
MKSQNSFLKFLLRIEGLPVLGVLLILLLVFLITAPDVFTHYLIYMSFLQTVPPQLVLALGLTLIITAGEMDLSFPAVVALSGFVFSWFFKHWDSPFSPWVGFILALGAGALVGYLNGFLVARLRVPSIMATLASQFFWYGITILLAGGLQVDIGKVEDTPIHAIFTGRLFNIIPAQALWSFGLAILLWFILNRHVFGEAIMFIGDNPNVAQVMGINVEAAKIKLFTLMGVISAFAGLLLTIEINVFFPTQGSGFMLGVMAAVFIGGTLISGGQGSVFGTLFGAYIIGSLQAGVVATGVTSYWVQSVMGLIMVLAVVINVLIGEGRMGEITSAFSRWGLFKSSNSDTQLR